MLKYIILILILILKQALKWLLTFKFFFTSWKVQIVNESYPKFALLFCLATWHGISYSQIWLWLKKVCRFSILLHQILDKFLIMFCIAILKIGKCLPNMNWQKVWFHFYWSVNSTTETTSGQSCWDWRACKIGACIILIFLVAVGAFIAYVMYQKYCCMWNLCECEKSQEKWSGKEYMLISTLL